MKKIATWLYQWFRALRYSILVSQAGAISHCHHSPTCGTFALRQLQENGLFVGGWRSMKRIGSCWLLPTWGQK